MKILFIAPRLHPNQEAWIQALKGQGHRVKYLVSYSLPINERFGSLKPVVVCSSNLPYWYRLMLLLGKLISSNDLQMQYRTWPDKELLERGIAQFNPDIVIIRESFTPLSLAAQRYARRHRIPSVQYSQAPLVKSDNLFIKLARKLQIIPDTRMTPVRESKSSSSSSANTFYVPLFVEPNPSSQPSFHDEDTLRVLFIGKFNSRRKNHLLMLEAVAELKENHSIKLTMVGSSVFPNEEYFQEIKEKIVALDLVSDVTILMDIPPEEMQAVYQKHDVFVLPSVNEPFAISPLEAMANGIPTIVTDSNGCRGHVIDGKNGFIIPSNNQDELVSAVLKCLDAKTLAPLKAGALAYTKGQNNEAQFLFHFTEMINTVLKNGTIAGQNNTITHE
jgi:glycosyltransferase involved in cell wall biosynthesis